MMLIEKIFLGLCLTFGNWNEFVTCKDDSYKPLELYMRKLRADPTSIPSYANTLTFTLNGPFLAIDPAIFQRQREIIGEKYPEESIAEGRKALSFMKSQYGVDFTDIEDDLLLRGNITRYDGAVTFFTFVTNPKLQYNMVSGTNLFTATRFNNLVSDSGWLVVFNKEFPSTGRVNKMIPAGSLGGYGNYFVRLGVHADTTVKRTPGFPGPVLNMHWQSHTAFYPPGPDALSITIDCDLFNEYLGPGHARGAFIARGIDKLEDFNIQTTYLTGGVVLTFPISVPHNVLPYDTI